MRRSPGSRVGAVVRALVDAGEGETITLADLDGLVADGVPLSSQEVSVTLGYLARTLGVVRSVGGGQWEIVNLSQLHKAEGLAWFDEADLESTEVRRIRALHEGKRPKCPTCNLTLGVSQPPDSCALCT